MDIYRNMHWMDSLLSKKIYLSYTEVNILKIRAMELKWIHKTDLILQIMRLSGLGADKYGTNYSGITHSRYPRLHVIIKYEAQKIFITAHEDYAPHKWKITQKSKRLQQFIYDIFKTADYHLKNGILPVLLSVKSCDEILELMR